jgi:nucleotide-binding universal stress UspA family protein
VDLDERGVHTLRYAGNFARHLGATLIVAHAVPGLEILPELYTDLDVRADLMGAARERIAEMQTLAETKAIPCVGAGNIGRFVSHAAESHKAGLVIAGRGGHGLMGRLRTHDYAIIRESYCPVLSI